MENAEQNEIQFLTGQSEKNGLKGDFKLKKIKPLESHHNNQIILFRGTSQLEDVKSVKILNGNGNGSLSKFSLRENLRVRHVLTKKKIKISNSTPSANVKGEL